MSSPAFGTPEWSAAKDFAVLMLLTGGNRYAAQELSLSFPEMFHAPELSFFTATVWCVPPLSVL